MFDYAMCTIVLHKFDASLDSKSVDAFQIDHMHLAVDIDIVTPQQFYDPNLGVVLRYGGVEAEFGGMLWASSKFSLPRLVSVLVVDVFKGRTVAEGFAAHLRRWRRRAEKMTAYRWPGAY